LFSTQLVMVEFLTKFSGFSLNGTNDLHVVPLHINIS